MRGDELLDKMEMIDPKYVEAADAKPKKKNTWMRWGALAACLLLLIAVGIRYIPQDVPEELPDLPSIHVSWENGAMGYEGYMAYKISEITNENPWDRKTKLSSLPVYKNVLTYSEESYGWAEGADFNEMEAFLMDVAGRLGLDTETLQIETNEPTPEEKEFITEKFELTGDSVPEGYFTPTAVIASADGIEIEVDQTMTATIFFEPGVALPEGYDCTYQASLKNVKKAAEYFKTEYAELIGFEDPVINIYGGDYTYDGQQSYSISFYDKNGSETEQIINYNFRQVHFHCDDAGDLFIVRIFNPDLSQNVGEYPIISQKEARELLEDGHYLTSVPYEMPGSRYVKKTELVYRTGHRDAYYMPYYKFYVELPEAELDNGLKDYGVYYVPAVESSYIENMPLWDGSFL